VTARDDAILTLPPPALAPETLAGHLARHWGLSGRLTPLTSERDLNHRLDCKAGSFVLRLTNPAEPAEMTDFQTRAHLHVAARDPGLPVQRLVPMTDGSPVLALPEGRLRLFTWLPGTPLAHLPSGPGQTRAIGEALARLDAALEDYHHPAADHVLLWDIRQLPALSRQVPALTDPDLRAEAGAFIADFTARVSPVLYRLPRQVCHADFNPHNLLADPQDPARLTGILDFGDMVRTPRICDLAVAASYRMAGEDPLDHLAALVSGYASHLPPTRDETALLYDLIQARMMATLVITAWRAALYPGNAGYILRNAPSARRGLAALRALGRDRATETIARAAGQE
jgi:Ser/Thr protein kinase RdoA (MazF antagonist)